MVFINKEDFIFL